MYIAQQKKDTFYQMRGFFVELNPSRRSEEDTDENELEVWICN